MLSAILPLLAPGDCHKPGQFYLSDELIDLDRNILRIAPRHANEAVCLIGKKNQTCFEGIEP